ncbi:universal stress protein [Marinomonas mediterranea]|jgi:Universal stress protein UspA and related nucleotide-binding proteins|uniref:UspA domain-containing protein n=1 Tax=Marinomonas mediterranea (strain ATCC 700492 / JCM 21426 / NBRC 103028 / MMB-1) TaxID=717774 RepID=F2JWD0_MARM1|nr:universal stress protein [Marinomonas mediterranea]ADZ90603.1 UspA domain-containing protein [Marinomonas mediterranea MMB-1]WCN08645.1 universal stress protein [Marinomonas mediterranea]WCN12700.1 universal stress protein [Marinomonas mediterranea]WCN16773.1 universal stress protein [Marinomonas mediterranea MMB-1]
MLPQINTILYACDLLDNKSSEALGYVMQLAKINEANVVLMHAMEPLTTHSSYMINNYIPEETLEMVRKETLQATTDKAETQLANFLEEHKSDLAGIPKPEVLITTGAPADAIEQTVKSKDVDLIVMNSRTHSTIGQMIIGSTANKVIHHSNVPVLVVPIK